MALGQIVDRAGGDNTTIVPRRRSGFGSELGRIAYCRRIRNWKV